MPANIKTSISSAGEAAYLQWLGNYPALSQFQSQFRPKLVDVAKGILLREHDLKEGQSFANRATVTFNNVNYVVHVTVRVSKVTPGTNPLVLAVITNVQ